MRESTTHLRAGNGRHDLNLLHRFVAKTNYGLNSTDGRIYLKGFVQGVPSHVEIAEAELTNTGISSVVRLRSVHLIEQVLRQGLTGLVMFSKGIEELFLVDEVLIELARQLHEITRYVGSALSRILATSQHTMQTMTELMQERAHLIICKQCRFVCSRTGKVHYIHDMRTMIFLALHILRLEIIHPRTATLTIPRMEVSVVHSKEFAFLIEDLISGYFGVIDLDFLVLLELKTIEFLSQTEDTFLHVLQLEKRTQIIIGDGILLHLEFLGVIAEIPRLEMCRIESMRMSVVLQFLHFLACSRHICVTELIQQFIDVLRRLCHGLIERFLCICLLAEEVCESKTGVDDLDDQAGVVKLTAHTLGSTCHIQLATDVTVVQILHHRDSSGRFEVQEPAFESFLLGIGAQHRLGVVIESGKKRLIGNEHRPSVGSLEDVLTILEGQFAQFSR